MVLTNAAVAARVSSRMYPVELPQGVTYPCLRYVRISGGPEHTIAGRSTLQHMRLQIDCFASDYYADAKALADDVISCLDGYSGTVTGGTIKGALLLDEADESMPEMKLYRVRLDFSVWFSET